MLEIDRVFSTHFAVFPMLKVINLVSLLRFCPENAAARFVLLVYSLFFSLFPSYNYLKPYFMRLSKRLSGNYLTEWKTVAAEQFKSLSHIL